MARNDARGALIAALATGATVADAAARAGVSTRTAFRWLGEPEVRAELDELQRATIGHARGRLLGLIDVAADSLRDVLVDADSGAAARVGAARTVLAQVLRLDEHVEIEERLVRSRLRSRRSGGGRRDGADTGRQCGSGGRAGLDTGPRVPCPVCDGTGVDDHERGFETRMAELFGDPPPAPGEYPPVRCMLCLGTGMTAEHVVERWHRQCDEHFEQYRAKQRRVAEAMSRSYPGLPARPIAEMSRAEKLIAWSTHGEAPDSEPTVSAEVEA